MIRNKQELIELIQSLEHQIRYETEDDYLDRTIIREDITPSQVWAIPIIKTITEDDPRVGSESWELVIETINEAMDATSIKYTKPTQESKLKAELTEAEKELLNTPITIGNSEKEATIEPDSETPTTVIGIEGEELSVDTSVKKSNQNNTNKKEKTTMEEKRNVSGKDMTFAEVVAISGDEGTANQVWDNSPITVAASGTPQPDSTKDDLNKEASSAQAGFGGTGNDLPELDDIEDTTLDLHKNAAASANNTVEGIYFGKAATYEAIPNPDKPKLGSKEASNYLHTDITLKLEQVDALLDSIADKAIFKAKKEPNGEYSIIVGENGYPQSADQYLDEYKNLMALRNAFNGDDKKELTVEEIATIVGKESNKIGFYPSTSVSRSGFAIKDTKTGNIAYIKDANIKHHLLSKLAGYVTVGGSSAWVQAALIKPVSASTGKASTAYARANNRMRETLAAKPNATAVDLVAEYVQVKLSYGTEADKTVVKNATVFCKVVDTEKKEKLHKFNSNIVRIPYKAQVKDTSPTAPAGAMKEVKRHASLSVSSEVYTYKVDVTGEAKEAFVSDGIGSIVLRDEAFTADLLAAQMNEVKAHVMQRSTAINQQRAQHSTAESEAIS